MITPEQLKELRALAEKATPGTWVIRPELPNEGQHRRLIGAYMKVDGPPMNRETLNGGVYVVETKGRDAIPNAKLIAAANPSTILALLDERDLLRDALTLVRMSRGWQYMSDETRVIIDAALSPSIREGAGE